MTRLSAHTFVTLLLAVGHAHVIGERLPLESAIAADADALLPWLKTVRQDLHKIPELMYDEHATSSYIKLVLEKYSITYRHPVAETGVVAHIGNGRPLIALRADMDALPVQEDTDLDFQSQSPGRMHACGHDGHMAMLLGAAVLLKRYEAALPGTALLIFQPAEEGGAGAKAMLDAGVLAGVHAAFGLHLWPALPSGRVGCRSGAIMAASYAFAANITGRGGHAAIPDRVIDPIVAAAQIIASLQTVVSRSVDPLSSVALFCLTITCARFTALATEARRGAGGGGGLARASNGTRSAIAHAPSSPWSCAFVTLVLSVTSIHGGDAHNIIPSQVQLRGTMRALSRDAAEAAQARAADVMHGLAEAHGCDASVNFHVRRQPYPPVVNDAKLVELVQRVATRAFGTDAYKALAEPSMAGEDFGFFAETVPAAFVWLGISNETAGAVHPLHSPHFVLDESVLPRGVALHVLLALDAMTRFDSSRDDEL